MSVFNDRESKISVIAHSGKASTPRISNDAGYGDYRVPLNALVVLCEKLDVDYDEALAQAEKNAKATAED